LKILYKVKGVGRQAKSFRWQESN